MLKISSIVLFAALMGAAIASPASAQSLETGTAADTFGWNAPQANGTAARGSVAAPPRHRLAAHRRGVDAFAMVPQNQDGNTFDPALTGGGSAGYNATVARDN